MSIPQSFIQELLARVDVVDIVGRYVQLKKSGANFMGLCPFHGEKSPSFSVSPSKQFYHCFGCGKNGNAIGFLMEHTGMTFVEAVKATFPFYVLRLLGGLLYLGGMLIMLWNVLMTATSGKATTVTIPAAAAHA